MPKKKSNSIRGRPRGGAPHDGDTDFSLAAQDTPGKSGAAKTHAMKRSPQAPRGKAERPGFEVDPVSLHVHERIEPATILSALSKRLKDAKGKDAGAWLQPDM